MSASMSSPVTTATRTPESPSSLQSSTTLSAAARGLAPPAAKYLAAKYGYDAERIPAARTRSIEILAALGERLGGATYFGGENPDALDAYVATFLTPLLEITEADCPNLTPPMRAGLAPAADELGPHVPPSLFALRARMFERHLEWPIVI